MKQHSYDIRQKRLFERNLSMGQTNIETSRDSQFEILSTLGNRMRIISDENRLKILFLLKNGELCVCKIYDALNLSQSLVSHHLAILRAYNLVNDRREGKWIHYSINKETLRKFNDLYLAVFDADKVETRRTSYEKCK